MLDHDSVRTLSQIAMRSVRHAQTKLTLPPAEPNQPLECGIQRFNGFSDAFIYRLTFDGGSYAIRSWPKRLDTPSKITFWSSVNATFSEDSACLKMLGASCLTPFPSLYRWQLQDEFAVSLLPYEDHLWTLCDWAPGQPVVQKKVDRSLVCHLARILGRLHANSISALDQDGIPLGQQSIRSNSIRERLDVLQSLDHSLFIAIDEASFFSEYKLSDRAKHCIAIVFERGPDWHRFLKICEGQTRICQWIVRDLWRDNVLVDEMNRFTSIVDLGAARIDWPGLDFHRYFSSHPIALLFGRRG